MEITINVVKLLDVQTFTSKKNGNAYNKFGFVGRTQDQYPKNVCFFVMGEDTWNRMNIMAGGTYQISFDVSSREWNGKWFTECTAFRAQSINVPNVSQPQQPTAPQVHVPDDNVPF